MRIVKPFFQDIIKNLNMKFKCRETVMKVVLIQKTAKMKYLTMQAKIEILISFWDKILGKLQTKAS